MSTPTKAAEIIREALNLLYHAAYAQGHHDTVEGCYTHVLSSDRHTYHDEAVQDLLRDEELRSLALLADMEREGEVVAWASKDQLEKLDFVGDMMVSSEKDETFSVPYDIPLYTHPSPTTADAKDSPVDLQEVIRAGDNLDHKFIDLVAFCAANIPESKLQDLVDDWAGHDERAAWTAATKPFRP